MVKAQPAMQFTFDISKKYMSDLAATMTDFGFESTVPGVLKRANVNIKELKEKLLADPAFTKQLQVKLKDQFGWLLSEILEDPDYYDFEAFKYISDAYDRVNKAYREIVAENQAELRSKNTADDIKAAVDLLKKAGYKVSE